MATKPDKQLQIRSEDPAKLKGGDLRGEVFLYVQRKSALMGSHWKRYDAVMHGVTLQLHEPGKLPEDARHLFDDYPEPAKSIPLTATVSSDLPNAKLRRLPGDKKWVFMIEAKTSGRPATVFAVRRQEAKDAWIAALTDRGSHQGEETTFVYPHDKEVPLPHAIKTLLNGLFEKIRSRRNLPGKVLAADAFAIASVLGHEVVAEERESIAGGRQEVSKPELLEWWKQNFSASDPPLERAGWDDAALPCNEEATLEDPNEDFNASDVPPAGGRVEHLLDINSETSTWNVIHQHILDIKPGRYQTVMLHKFLRKFLDVVHETVRLIVRELSLPDYAKTLMYLPKSWSQASDDIDYDDRGQTYIRSGLVYRVADSGQPNESDSSNLILSKLAAIDWQSSKAVRETAGTYFLRPVLSCVIDYLGVRVFVSAIPPVDEESIVFDKKGIRPGFSDSPIGAAVERISTSRLEVQLKELNIGDRPIVKEPEKQSATFLLPLKEETSSTSSHASVGQSIVIYQGKTWNYVLTNGTVLPSELPNSKDTAENLIRRLRQELVLSYVPRRDKLVLGQEMPSNEQIAETTIARILNEQIAGLARALDELNVFVYDSISLTSAMHNFGLNMRHLGRLYEQCSVPHTRGLVLNECIARACKHLHRQLLRRVMFSGSKAGRASADNEATIASTDFLNTIVGQGVASDTFWQNVLPLKVQEFYGAPIAKSLRRFQQHMPQLIEALQYHCSFDVKVTASTNFDAPQPFTVNDLRLTLKLKNLDCLRGDNIEDLATDLARQGKYAKAAVVLANARQDRMELFKNMDVRSRRANGLLLYKMAQAQAARGNISQALLDATNAIQALPPLSALYVRVNIMIAHLHVERNDYAAASTACKKAQDHCIWALGEHHVLMIHTLAAAADVRYAQAKAVARLVDVNVHGRLDEQKEASRFADQALTAATKLLGISHSLTVALAYKAASIKLEMDEVNAAQHTMESVKSAIRGRPADMVGANCLQVLASTYARNLEVENAYNLAQESLSIRLKLDLSQTHGLASCFRANAVIAQKMIGNEGAAQLYADCAEILEPASKGQTPADSARPRPPPPPPPGRRPSPLEPPLTSNFY